MPTGPFFFFKCWALGALAMLASGALAADAWRPVVDPASFSTTHLLEIKQTDGHSKRLAQFGGGGFETAQGAWVSFSPWYRSPGRDLSIAWMTQLQPGLGVIWGASTGERGVKYSIAPSLKLGAVYQTQITKNGVLSFKGTVIVGGGLREKSCTADYGEVGGTQEVNCRLAATELPPSQTLQYLVHDRPANRTQLLIQFTQLF